NYSQTMQRSLPSDDEDTDALFAALESEENTTYQAKRLEQLQSELAETKNPRSSSSTSAAAAAAVGTLINNSAIPVLSDDQSLLDFTTQYPRCIIHFFHPDFSRCATMDKHLHALAAAHSNEVHFARIDVRNASFVVEKLKIQILPCVIGFVDGVGVERITGFEGLGDNGLDAEKGFSTAKLESRFLRKGLLVKGRIEDGDGDDDEEGGSGADRDEDDGWGKRRGIRSGNASKRNVRDDEEDDDWD
ncbi:hypothetical protein AJ80_09591, partial [Polytolypa hystricis UAMH7299]